jgi:hypothetical protein
MSIAAASGTSLAGLLCRSGIDRDEGADGRLEEPRLGRSLGGRAVATGAEASTGTWRYGVAAFSVG